VLAKTFPTPPASPGLSSTAMKDASARLRSCAISPATCRKRRRRSFMRSKSVPQGSALGQDDACGLAVEAEFLCRFDGRPDDQSRSRTLHGQAHGCQDHRSEGESLSLISQPDEITRLI